MLDIFELPYPPGPPGDLEVPPSTIKIKGKGKKKIFFLIYLTYLYIKIYIIFFKKKITYLKRNS